MDFKKFRKVIDKDIEAAGLTVHVRFTPSRTFTALEKRIGSGKPVYSFKRILEIGDDAFETDEYGFPRVKDDVPAASGAEAEGINLDFMKVLALFTDDEALVRLIEDAPKKPDGHLRANCFALSCDMDGMNSRCEFYSLRAKVLKDDAIEIKPERKKYHSEYDVLSDMTAHRLLASERYADIVKRLGLL